MTFGGYLRVLRERWRVIVIVLLLAVGAATLLTALTPKRYSANVQVFVAPVSTSSDSFSAVQAVAYAQAQVSTYAAIVTAPDILKRVENDLNLGLTNAELKSKITASAPVQQTLVNISVVDSSPTRAAEIANSTARAFTVVIQSYATDSKGRGVDVRLHITDPATVPSSPTSPNIPLNVVVAIVLGLAFGAAIAIVRDLLDTRIKSSDALARIAGSPIMGVVVNDPKTVRHPIAARAGRRNLRAENYRQLRANLQFAGVDEHPRLITITSSVPSEGKTTVAINLASALAEAGFSVCLVDADLRRPTIAKTLGLVESVGLTSVLTSRVPLDEVLQQAGMNLHVLASGPVPPNPSEVLGSAAVRELLRTLLNRMDYVIVDTAPLLPVADGSIIASMSDGALVVARHGATTDAQVRRSMRALAGVDVKVIGMILNRAPMSKETDYEYYQMPDKKQGPVAAPRPRPGFFSDHASSTNGRALQPSDRES